MYKRLLKFTVISSVSFLILLVGHAEPVFSQDLEIDAGAASADITPPIGYDHYRGTSTGVKDPLYAKAIVFRDEDQQAALVVCDLIRITRELSTEVRSLAAEKTGIPYENIIVAATHTHTGPAYRFDMKEYIQKKRKDILTDEQGESYSAFLIERVTQAIVEANDSIIRVSVESGSGKAEGISFNRRFIMKDGRVRFNPGVGNSNAVRPVGPIDPEVGMILLRRISDNQPIAGLINFANHTDTVGGTEYSADYPAYLAKALREALGSDFLSIFGQGTSGNINHIDVVDSTHQKGAGTVTQRIGETLAEVVEKEIPNLNKNGPLSLAVRSEFVYAPLQQYTDEELNWAQTEKSGPLYNEREFLQNIRARKVRKLEDMQSEGKAIPPTAGEGPWALPLEVQVIRIGEHIAIIGLPGEVFVELGLAIKEASPFETTLVIEMTNININYVPDQSAFDQGGYETINSRIAPGGGEMMVESVVEILNDLK